jgi:tRNA(Ile)-lysidine synthase
VPGVKSVKLLRPLLEFSRSELRDYLTERGIPWIDDPMNDDGKFARNRVRKLLPVLAEAGIPASRIVDAGRHLARARTALDDATQTFLVRHAEFGTDAALINADALKKLPREIGLRALSEALRRVAGREYRPRFARLERLFDAAISPDFRGQTLAGCCIEKPTRSASVFGAHCLSVRPEPPRKPSARAARTGSDLGEQLPGSKLP